MVLEGDEVLVTLIDYKGDIEHRLTIHGVVHHAHK
jgi:translation initiation factor IF-1